MSVYRGTHQCGERSNAAFRRQSAANLTSHAPHDSKARLRVVMTRRRFMAKPCTPHLHCAACAALQDRDRQCNLSLGGSTGGVSFEKETPPRDARQYHRRCHHTALCAESKNRGPRFRTAPFLCRFRSRSRSCSHSRYCSHIHCCSRSHRRSRRRRRSG